MNEISQIVASRLNEAWNPFHDEHGRFTARDRAYHRLGIDHDAWESYWKNVHDQLSVPDKSLLEDWVSGQMHRGDPEITRLAQSGRMPWNQDVWHGVKRSQLGNIIRLPHLHSASLIHQAATDFEPSDNRDPDQVRSLLRISLKAGDPGMYVEPFSAGPPTDGEHEVLLPPSEYRVTGRSRLRQTIDGERVAWPITHVERVR